MATRPTSKYQALLFIAVPLLFTACGEEDDRPSEVQTTRILGIMADTPFAKPGRDVQLSLLAFDGSPRALLSNGERRATSSLWIRGCVNPPGDSYVGCMPYLRNVVDELGNTHLANQTVSPEMQPGTVAWGDAFTASVPTELISSRPLAAGVVHPYGVQFVFVAYCGGVLRSIDAAEDEFPLGCFDSITGERLGRDDFEFGFYPIYAYEDLENENPKLESLNFEGATSTEVCSDDQPCGSAQHCGSAGTCIPVVEACTAADEDDCAGYEMSISVPKSSVETAVVAHLTTAEAFDEGLWVSYYANGGSFEEDARTINDPHAGWFNDYVGHWRAKTERNREVRLWAIVRDNRNGVAWAWQDVWVK